MKESAVLLSLGSNLGDRKKHIKSALKKLEASGLKILSVSSYYETEPVGKPGQPPFINIVCRAETSHSPFVLLDICQEIETVSGRMNKGDGSPRTIDIDILMHGKAKISTQRLTLPHPGMYLRNFVLIPLREIHPEFVDPDTGQGIDQLILESEDHSWVKRSS